MDSPDGMDGVEGLTHDHLMEISPGVYMKFQHAYVVGDVEALGVKLLDPHGKVEGEDKHFYNAKLAKEVRGLSQDLHTLIDELEKSNYSTLSKRIRNKLDEKFKALEAYTINTPIEKIKNKWEKLLSRKELIEVEDSLTGLKPRGGQSFVEQVKKNKILLEGSKVGKGFWIGEKQFIEGKQDVDYQIFKNNFESVRINKLKK